MDFSMLLFNNNRSKAYLQNLLENGFRPETIIVLSGDERSPEHTDNDVLMSGRTAQKYIRCSKDAGICFDEKEHILPTINKNRIPYVSIPSADVNSAAVIEAVKNIRTPYIIYSGRGGSILRKEILGQGRKFIHVHPGLLPRYKGSTTIYYSMLIEGIIGASVIIMEEKIDGGPVLYSKSFKLTEKNVDFDYVLDPAVRTSTLMDFMKLHRNGSAEDDIDAVQNSGEGGNTFYIIHPVLKHAAILGLTGK